MKPPTILLLSFLFGATVWPVQALSEAGFPVAAETVHRTLIKQFSSEQQKALAKVYPAFRLVSACAGDFSGTSQQEWVLGIWKPLPTRQAWKTPVHRVGLIKQQKAWEVHLIDDEIEQDASLSHSFPMQWQYKLDQKGFEGALKCGVKSEFGPKSDLSFGHGNKPLFDLKQIGLDRNKVVCFATDDVYNNWDCLVYSPKNKRFRLWFQQAYAD